MKTLKGLATTTLSRESINDILTYGALLFPFLPNAYRTFYIIIATIAVIIDYPLLLRKENLPLYIFLMLSIVTSLFSPMPLKAILKTKGIVFDLIIPFVFFAFSKQLKRDDLLKKLSYFVIFFTFLALLTHFLYPRGWHFFNRQSALVGFMGGKLTYAGVISFLFPLIIFQESVKIKKLIPSFLAAALVLTSLAINNSRSYYLGIAAFILLFILFAKPYLKVIYLLLLLTLASTVLLNQRSYEYLKRSAPTEKNMSPYLRIQMWKTGLNIFKAKPLTGIGYELWGEEKVREVYLKKYGTPKLKEILEKNPDTRKPVSGHVHSNYIMALVNGGILLFIGYLFIFIFYGSLFLRSKNIFGLYGIGLLLIMLIAGTFEYSFSDAEVIQTFAFSLGLLLNRAKNDESNHKNS
ncbi:MAG: O-antigen ligase family protein [bacterium]|nr:O-antigen ligase family protein [bacterium]